MTILPGYEPTSRPRTTRDAAVCLGLADYGYDLHVGRRIEEDPTGFLNEGFRPRCLETGCFITRDPLGFVDGPNVYTYVKQNPWTSFDPEGLEERFVTPSYSRPATLMDVLMPATAAGLSGGRSPWGGQNHAIEHSQQVTQPVLKTIATTGIAIAAAPILAPAVMEAPTGAAVYVAATQLAHSPAAQATAVAVVSGAAAYNETGSVKAAVTTAALTLVDGYSQGAFSGGGKGSAPGGKSASQVKSNTTDIVGSVQSGPTEAYNRTAHYGRTPTAADRKAVGVKPGEVADHTPSLVQRYYEGDPATGEKPGYQMTQGERKASAGDRSRMQPQPRSESDAQGAAMSRYSREKKKEHNLGN